LLISSRYATLTKSGEADRLAAQDLSSIQGLNDAEIQDAIEELKRSTAAIEKQSEALRAQQNAMSALVKSDLRTSQARSQTNNSQLKKWNAEKGHVGKAVGEIVFCGRHILIGSRLRNCLRVWHINLRILNSRARLRRLV
jgi:hypothetical protein